MLIPAFEERIGILELHEKRIEAYLGHPVDEVENIVDAVCAFDAYPTVDVTGRLLERQRALKEVGCVQRGDGLTGSARSRVSYTELMEESVNGDKQSDISVGVDVQMAFVQSNGKRIMHVRPTRSAIGGQYDVRTVARRCAV